MSEQLPPSKRQPPRYDRADANALKSKGRIGVIILAVLAMAFIVGDLIARRTGHVSVVTSGGMRPWAHSSSAAVLRGYAQAQSQDADDADDENLKADEADAGVLWAKAHHPTSPDECPMSIKAFRKGCVDYLHRAQVGATAPGPNR